MDENPYEAPKVNQAEPPSPAPPSISPRVRLIGKVALLLFVVLPLTLWLLVPLVFGVFVHDVYIRPGWELIGIAGVLLLVGASVWIARRR